MSILQAAFDVRGQALQGAVGDWAAQGDQDRWGSGFNQSPQAVQVSTVTVTDPGDSLAVIITINGVDVEIDTGTGQAAAGIGADLAEAINADPVVRANVIATFDTVTLTLTAITPGLVFTVSIADDPNATLSAVTAVTAADEADAIPVGRAVITQGYASGEGHELVALAASALLTAQVQTLTIAFVDAAVINISVWEIRGTERIRLAEVSEASGTDRDTTIDALIVLLNAALPAASVIATADNATATAIVFTAEVAGLEFEVTWLAGHEGATLPAITLANTTGPNESTSIARALRGVSMRPLDEEVSTIGGTEPTWPANAGLRFAQEGKLWVESAEVITSGAPVFIELGVAADNGQLFIADSATRLALPRAMARWDRDGAVAADFLAAVRLNIP